MKRLPNGIIVLSKRNLLSLLHKLEMEGSARTLISPEGTIVQAEDDATHYAERDAGPMHPETEEFIRRHHESN